MRRRTWILGIAIAWGMWAAPGASADPAVQISVSPGSVTLPGQSTLTYTLKITASAAHNEIFKLSATPPSFGSGETQEGPALSEAGFPGVSGATVGAGGSGSASYPSCIHAAFGGSFFFFDMKVPAGQTATVTWPFVTGPAIWPGMSLAPMFDFSPALGSAFLDPGFGPSSLAAPFSIQGPAPQVLGRQGVRIVLDTKPATAVAGHLGEAKIGVGKRITIRGATDPPVSKQNIRLTLITEKARVPKLLKKLRTDKQGRFHYRYKATSPGFIEVGAEYRSQSSALADEFACAKGFQVTKPHGSNSRASTGR